MNTAKDGFIKWIRKDLDELIHDARIALEDYAEGTGDQALMTTCVEKLHQVHGTIRMVQLQGAALLAEEVEELAKAIQAETVGNPNEAIESLMLGIVQLPDYLDRIQGGAADTPLPILSVINELRASRDAPLLSELNLFGQDLERQLSEVVEMGQPNAALPKLAGQLRLQFHKGLLKWLRGLDPSSGMREVLTVSDQIANNAGTGRVRDFFRAVAALAVSIATKSLDAGVTVKQLLGKVDREIKRIIDGGEQALVDEPPLELATNILYYVAQSNSDDERVIETRNAYDFSSLASLGSGSIQQVGGLNAELFDTVYDAVQGDLTKIKDELDLYMRTGKGDVQRLEEVRDPMAKLAETLGMLGQGDLRTRLKEQVDGLDTWIADGVAPSEKELMAMASAILSVESELEQTSFAEGMGQEPQKEEKRRGDKEFNRLLEATLHEAAVDMAHIKEALSGFFSTGDSAALKNVKGRFKTVQGALEMLQLGEPAKMLGKVATYVESRLGQGGPPPASAEINALADVITSIEFFMESVADDFGEGQDILAFTRGAMDRLSSEEEAVSDEDTAEAVQETADSTGISSTTDTSLHELETITELDIFEDDGEGDSEILGIFLEEASEELEVIRELVPRWLDNLDDKESLTRFRRSFHTLKGSGRLVGAKVISEFSWSIENLLNRIIDGTVQITDPVGDLMRDVLTVLPQLVESETTKQKPSVDYQTVMERAFALAEGRAPVVKAAKQNAPKAAQVDEESLSGVSSLEPESLAEFEASSEPDTSSLQSEQSSVELDTSRESGFDFVPEPPEVTLARAESSHANREDAQQSDSVAEPVSATDQPTGAKDTPPIELDETLKEIFESESSGHLRALDEYLEQCDPKTGAIVTTQVTRALHTLHGSSDMAGVVPIARLAKVSEKYFDILLEHRRIADGDDIGLLQKAVDLTRAVLSVINVPGEILPDWEVHVDKVSERLALVEAEVASQLAEEEQDSSGLSLSQIDPSALIDDTRVYTEEDETGVVEDEEKDDDLDSLSFVDQDSSIDSLSEIGASFDLSLIGTDSESSDAVGLHSELPEISLEEIADAQSEGVSSGFHLEELQEESEPVDVSIDTIPAPIEEDALTLSSETGGAPSSMEGLEEIEGKDGELIEIFLEEAQELNEALEAGLQAWQKDLRSKASIAELQRVLHTMKGASRLAGVMQIGDLSHSLESLLIAVDRGSVPVNDQLFSLVRRVGDHLMSQVDSLASVGRVPPGRELTTLLETVQRGEFEGQDALAKRKGTDTKEGGEADSAEELESILFDEHQDNKLSQSPDSHSDQIDQSDSEGSVWSQPIDFSEPLSDSELRIDSKLDSELTTLVPQDGKHARGKSTTIPPKHGRSDLIRVRADQLDRMVNNAGEISIYRTRLEQQNGEMAFNLNELDQTVSRLRQQLRVLEIETETQILYRYERDKEAGAEFEGEQGKDFDPLEMDRFSTIQQVSRSLAETINDLVSIRDMMDERNRETETLLLQQSRLSNDLQEGLLRTRMVTFKQVVPRLERLVRQTAQTLGKKAELTVEGAAGEVDRSILDRMVAPLEHILRNAVSHGIESVEQRRKTGKPETGQIMLVVRREGRDVVITVSDDGGGIDYSAVRKRAVERGLIGSEADIANDDLVQFVLEPGFSTATSITQISGRGVGMDVVSSEVKQLGGTLDMESTPGAGSTFNIRLPFTLALTEALLVNVGDDVFAVPHTSIEGVTRITRQELEACYLGGQEHIVYAGNKYRVRYLGEMLEFVKPGGDFLAEQQNRWYPLLLVRHGDHRVAVQVDQMIGSRQIVVKSVGVQLSTVRWVTGGTILGDGRVALILDVNALVRLSVIHQKRVDKAVDQDTTTTISQFEVSEAGHEKPVTVMIVDDSITVRKVTTRLLSRHSMEVVTALDGVDAVAKLQDVVPDIMLVDIEMPRMDGYELTRHIRHSEELKDVPIIMITSRSGEKHRQRAMELGVNTYLGKPYQESELLDNIYSLLAAEATE